MLDIRFHGHRTTVYRLSTSLSSSMARFTLGSFMKRHVYGGYECDFIGDVPEKYICSAICAKVLRDPHLTECCGQHFCESCLQEWFRRQRREVCPHCRKENFTHILDKPIKREISRLKMYCTNREEGCSWSGVLEDFDAHLDSTRDGCGYVEVDCNNKCGEKLKRRDLASHLSDHCSLRQYQCRFCGQEGTYRNITSKHYRRCPNYPLVCPNACGETKIKRKYKDIHQNKCPLEPVKCPFQEAGCEVHLVRKDLDDHIERSTQEHLLQVMSAYRKIKHRLEDEIDDVCEDLKSVKRRCEYNKDDLEELRNKIM